MNRPTAALRSEDIFNFSIIDELRDEIQQINIKWGGKPYFFDSHIGGSFGNRKGYRIVEIHADDKMSTHQCDAENAKITNTHTF